MSTTTTITIRLEVELKNRLDIISKATHRSQSFLAVDAIRDFVEMNEWQIQEIKAAVIEADNGDFVCDKEVSATLANVEPKSLLSS